MEGQPSSCSQSFVGTTIQIQIERLQILLVMMCMTGLRHPVTGLSSVPQIE
jgi:hypothetical protein